MPLAAKLALAALASSALTLLAVRGAPAAAASAVKLDNARVRVSEVSVKDGRLAGYAVDAYETEPPAAHPLLAHERVVTTPHVGAFTAESVARATKVAVDNLLAALGKGA